jgi:nitroreductase
MPESTVVTISKIIPTESPIVDLIQQRWSPRSFSSQEISKESLQTILEAAGLAFSANNLQPWHYAYAFKGTEGFDTLWNALAPGNQPWAKDAAVLLVSFTQVVNDKGAPNPWSQHDLGAANATLALQAFSMGIHSHFMAGFDKSKALAATQLNGEIWQPVAMAALGYLGPEDQLEEPYLSRERTPRVRKSVSEISSEIA